MAKRGNLPQHTQQRGLTLIELLATMVIFSLVVAVFAQALFQIAAVERRASEASTQFKRLWATGFGQDEQMRTQPAWRNVAADAARGSEREYEARLVPDAGPMAGRALRLRWRLLALEGTGSGGSSQRPWGLVEELLDNDLATQPGAQGPKTLAQWSGPVQFRFYSHSAPPSASWPPLQTTSGRPFAETVPRAVAVVDANGNLAHIWVFRGRTSKDLASSYAPSGGVVP